jgi:hypothetical protein
MKYDVTILKIEDFWTTEVLAANSEFPGAIPGVTRFSE